MDDLIQILVFVVTFIVFVASAIMKQKKKPNGKPSNIDNFVESLFGIPEPQPQPIRKAFVEEYIEEEETPIVQPMKVEKNYEEGVRAITDDFIKKEEEDLEEDEDDSNSFDVREAIINSEIINRKYF